MKCVSASPCNNSWEIGKIVAVLGGSVKCVSLGGCRNVGVAMGVGLRAHSPHADHFSEFSASACHELSFKLN